MNTIKKVWIIFAAVVAEILITGALFKASEGIFGGAFIFITLLTVLVGGMWASGELKD